MPTLSDMSTWADRLGSSKLRTFTSTMGASGSNRTQKSAAKLVKLAREGHKIAWEFQRPGGKYTGRLLIDGEITTPSDATKKYF